MDANERLACLRDLAFIRELDEGFPSQRDCIDWANTVAPVLRFRRWPTQDECGLKTAEAAARHAAPAAAWPARRPGCPCTGARAEHRSFARHREPAPGT